MVCGSAWCVGRRGVRSRGPLHQAGLSIGLESANPGVHTLTRDPHGRGDVSLGPAGLKALNHQQPGMKGRTGITVGHENLRRMVDLDKPHPTRGFSSHQADTPATNVMSRYI